MLLAFIIYSYLLAPWRGTVKLRLTASFVLACYKVENAADWFSMVSSATVIQYIFEIIKTRAEDDVQLRGPQGRPAWLATSITAAPSWPKPPDTVSLGSLQAAYLLVKGVDGLHDGQASRAFPLTPESLITAMYKQGKIRTTCPLQPANAS